MEEEKENKHRDWLKSHEGLHYQIAGSEKDINKKWLENYKDEKYNPNINLIEVDGDELIIEFDENPNKQCEDKTKTSTQEQRDKAIEKTIEKLKEENVGYDLFDHKGKCKHIHVYLNKPATKEQKESIIKYFVPKEFFDFVDLSLCGVHLIAVPYCKHWRHKTIKELVENRGGLIIDIDDDKYKKLIVPKIENDFIASSGITADIVKNVKISDLAREFGSKKGKNKLWHCLMHHDKNPSLSLDDNSGLYNCFGCGKHGNIVSFVSEVEHVTIDEALIKLKERAGLIKENKDAVEKIEDGNEEEFNAGMRALFTKKKNIVLQSITQKLLEKYHFKSLLGKKMDEIYIYDNGIYLPIGRDTIKIDVEKILIDKCKTHDVNEIINKVARMTSLDRGILGNADKNLICLENGVLDIRDMILKEHSPNYNFLSKIPTKYYTNADCPLIKKFFSEVLYEEDIPVMQEWLGYLLYRSYFEKKAMICVGDPDTGKTTLLNLITKFIGIENKSGVSLQKLTSDRFSGAFLYRKHLNAYDDLSSKDIDDHGAFKIATGGGYIQAEFKFGDQFEFINFAKLLYATNKIPPTQETDDDAYFKRWIVIRFDNAFDSEVVDKFIIEKITTEQELSGLLNYAIEGLKRLLKNNHFSYKKSIGEIKSLMQRSSNPLVAFIQDCIFQKDDAWISKEDMYEQYTKYVNKENLPRMTKEKFGRNIKKLCSYIIDGKKDKTTGWYNIEVNIEHRRFGT